MAAVLDAGSEKAAAHRLGLSHSTVKHHLANARSKVGAETAAQPDPGAAAAGAGGHGSHERIAIASNGLGFAGPGPCRAACGNLAALRRAS